MANCWNIPIIKFFILNNYMNLFLYQVLRLTAHLIKILDLPPFPGPNSIILYIHNMTIAHFNK